MLQPPCDLVYDTKILDHRQAKIGTRFGVSGDANPKIVSQPLLACGVLDPYTLFPWTIVEQRLDGAGSSTDTALRKGSWKDKSQESLFLQWI